MKTKTENDSCQMQLKMEIVAMIDKKSYSSLTAVKSQGCWVFIYLYKFITANCFYEVTTVKNMSIVVKSAVSSNCVAVFVTYC